MLTTHGLGHKAKREYESWSGAKGRCFNRKNKLYVYYGGRGIRMCDEWRDDFAAFYAYLGPCPKGYEIDRIDNNGHYEPGNVRWANHVVQNRNKRSNRFVQFHGERMTMAEAGRRSGLPRTTFCRYYERGMFL